MSHLRIYLFRPSHAHNVAGIELTYDSHRMHMKILQPMRPFHAHGCKMTILTTIMLIVSSIYMYIYILNHFCPR